MARSNRDRLNGYYQAELDSLRIAGNEFAQAYPSIASELSLSEGEARDPHIEHLIQSFAWMMGRLRMQVEAETRKIPEMMLEELAPNTRSVSWKYTWMISASIQAALLESSGSIFL